MMVRVICLLLFPLNLFSQPFFAAPLQGMGNTTLSQPTLYSLPHNASTLSFLPNPQVGIAYQPHFLANELRHQALYFGMPISRGSVGIAIQQYGIPQTSTVSTFSGAFSRQFGNQFSSSVTLNYHGFHVKDVFSEQSYSVDLGFYFQFTEDWSMGSVWKNISFANYSDLVDVSIEEIVGIGTQYKFSDELMVASDILYSNHWDLIYRIGVEYDMANRIAFRVGLNTSPMVMTVGIGAVLKPFRIDLSTTYHTRLGTAPQIALAYDF